MPPDAGVILVYSTSSYVRSRSEMVVASGSTSVGVGQVGGEVHVVRTNPWLGSSGQAEEYLEGEVIGL